MRLRHTSTVSALALTALALTFATAAPAFAERAVDVKSASQIGHYRTAALGSTYARGGGPGESTTTRDTYVHERFARDLVNGCEYRADVRGSIRPDGAPNVRANLVVNADLHCPEVASVRAPAKRVDVRNVSAEHLAERLSANAKINATRDGRTCQYEPAFEFRDGTLVNTDVNVRCRR